ncbi:MAG: hypothetical protein ACRC37_00070 [Lentisphaeria bacterium]
MKQIIFICSGNTSRSPLAAALFNSIAEKNQPNTFFATSAGLFAFTNDEANYKLAKFAYSKNINIFHHRSKKVSSYLLEQAHLIITFTRSQMLTLNELFPHLSQISMLTLSDIMPPMDNHFPAFFELIQDNVKKLFTSLNGQPYNE